MRQTFDPAPSVHGFLRGLTSERRTRQQHLEEKHTWLAQVVTTCERKIWSSVSEKSSQVKVPAPSKGSPMEDPTLLMDHWTHRQEGPD